MTERLLNIEDAAALLGRTPHAIYQMVARRQIPFRKSGRRVFFLDRELREFIDDLPGVTLEELRERGNATV
jgi:excisionase family DNA binding protein